MRVDVYESRRDQQTAGVEGLGGSQVAERALPLDCDDLPALHSDVEQPVKTCTQARAHTPSAS